MNLVSESMVSVDVWGARAPEAGTSVARKGPHKNGSSRLLSRVPIAVTVIMFSYSIIRRSPQHRRYKDPASNRTVGDSRNFHPISVVSSRRHLSPSSLASTSKPKLIICMCVRFASVSVESVEPL